MQRVCLFSVDNSFDIDRLILFLQQPTTFWKSTDKFKIFYISDVK